MTAQFPAAVPTDSGAYSGTDNLEVMAEAINYNAYLVDLVRRHAAAGMPTLDFGAGTGTFAALLRGRNLDVACLEPDANLQRRLRADEFKVYADTAEIADGAFGFAYSLNVFEHIADHAGAAAELFRLLRPGGRALVYVPAFAALFGEMDRKVGHVRRYRRSELARLFAAAGFVVERGAYADSLGFLATLAFNLRGCGDGSINPRMLRLYDRAVFPLSRACDRLVSSFFGKNAYVVLRKPGGDASAPAR